MTNEITNFEEFGLNSALLDSINKQGFTKPTAIQQLTIEPILDGKDIFALAETGSGKTAAFAIPIIEHIVHDELVNEQNVHYVVLSPTRELAQQTFKVFKELGDTAGIKSVCLIGGESIEKQKDILKDHPHILVATPGRIVDLLKQGCTDITNTYGVVFDEADRLFDMGFKKDVEYILGLTPEDRQLIMVSATTNRDVMNTAYKFHSEPIELNVGQDSMLVDHIDHKLAMLSSNEKMGLLVKTIRDHEDAYAIVFCNTKFQTHVVAEWLMAMGFKAKAISGGLAQNRRTALLKEFREKKITILVCTDVAARGLDIKDVNLVINYDMPQDPANYVHRIGRTGRAGKKGEAISFCAHEDCEYLDPIFELIGESIPKVELYKDDFATDLCKRPYIDRKTFKVVDRNTGKPVTNKPVRKSSEVKEKKVYTPKEASSTKSSSESKPRDIVSPEKFDERVFTTQSSNEDEAKKAAMSFFKVKYDSQIELKTKEEGRKKFFLFGARLTKYSFTVKPTYKKAIMPFLINIIKLANLKLYAKFSFDGKKIKLFFSGNDEKMLTRNGNELLQAFEYITRLHLYNTMKVPREVRLSFKCKGIKNQEDSLLKLVDRMAKKVIESKETITLKAMNSADRRIVHQHLDKHTDVSTFSLGDGRMKKIEIRLN